PYGELYDQTGSDPRFTGQLAAIATNNYDFPMREYSPRQGRWWTPDPAGLAAVDPNNPQSWNRYAYVNGTPINSADPLGLCHESFINGVATVVDDAPGDCAQNSTVTVKDKPEPIPMDEDVVGMTIEEI